MDGLEMTGPSPGVGTQGGVQEDSGNKTSSCNQ